MGASCRCLNLNSHSFRCRSKVGLAIPLNCANSRLAKLQKQFNSVDVMLATDKLVVIVVAPKMLIKTDVHQSVVVAPAISVNDAINVGFSPDNYLGGICGFGVDIIAAFEQTKNDSPARSTAPTSVTEVKPIDFKLSSQWQAFEASLVHAAFHEQVDVVDRTHRYAGQGGAFDGCQIDRRAATSLAKLRLTFLERRKYLFKKLCQAVSMR